MKWAFFIDECNFKFIITFIKKALKIIILSAFPIRYEFRKSDSAGSRTQDPILKRDVLYQLSY